MAKINATIDRYFDIDPKDAGAIEGFGKQEVELVTRCPLCGPTLRKSWHTPERKALAQKGYSTSLQTQAAKAKTKKLG